MFNLTLYAQGARILSTEFIPDADLVDGLHYPAVEERSNGLFVRKIRYIIGFDDAPTAQTFANTLAHELHNQYEEIVKRFFDG